VHAVGNVGCGHSGGTVCCRQPGGCVQTVATVCGGQAGGCVQPIACVCGGQMKHWVCTVGVGWMAACAPNCCCTGVPGGGGGQFGLIAMLQICG
jgi:hypothetical protein